MTKDRTSELRTDKKSIPNQNNREKRQEKKMSRTFGNLWDNDEKSNILVIGIPEGEEIESGSERIFEEMTALIPPL